MAHRLDRRLKVRKGRIVLKGVPLNQVETLLEKRVRMPEQTDIQGIRKMLEALDDDRELMGIQANHQRAGDGPPKFDDEDLSSVEEGFWRDFLRHHRFLQQGGFVDDRDHLTADGRWASRLRLDHPIIVAEAIRGGVFEERPAPVVAGLIAPFVLDREREVLLLDSEFDEMGDAFDSLMAATHGIRRAMETWGFETPLLQFWPAAALYLWAKNTSWQELRSRIPLDEGDLVSLILRTADHLRQLCDLVDTHPQVTRTARIALQRIQREPVVY
jgi:superfamily II RNA helicase